MSYPTTVEPGLTGVYTDKVAVSRKIGIHYFRYFHNQLGILKTAKHARSRRE
jgi:hypothetical protein